MVYFVCPLLVATLSRLGGRFNFPCVDMVAQFTKEVSVCLVFAPPILNSLSLIRPSPYSLWLCRNPMCCAEIANQRGAYLIFAAQNGVLARL
jgi:hypothetical protein